MCAAPWRTGAPWRAGRIFRQVLAYFLIRCGTIRPTRPGTDGAHDIDVNQGDIVKIIDLPRQRDLALAVCVGIGLTACGGGSSGGVKSNNIPAVPSNNIPSVPSNNIPSTSPTTPTPNPSNPSGTGTSTPPLDIQLTATNVKAAQAAGAKGSGATIGIVDSGVNRNNPALTGRVTSNLTFVDPTTNNTTVDDVVGHGTVVAETAAGVSSGMFAGGVAPSASIVSARIIADKSPTDDGSGQGNAVTSAGPLGAINQQVIAAGATIINNSWDGLYWSESATSTTLSFHDAYRDAAFNTLYVFAAGNRGDANPSNTAALPSRAPDLERGWLTVVALDSNHPDTIAAYSNRCGIAMNYCLAAPGDVVTLAPNATDTNKTYVIASGTSLAAPQVSGAAAVVSGVFPTLSMASVRDIILGTADDLGAPGVDSTYGYGRLNAARAIRGPSRLDWGRFDVNLTDKDGNPALVTFSNDIAGTGSLYASGVGQLTLTSAANTFSGGTTVADSSILESVGNLPGPLTVRDQGFAFVHGNIGGNVLVRDNGRLQSSDAGTRIDGNLTLTSGSRLAQTLGAPVAVGGVATLAGDFYVAGVTRNYQPTGHQQVLSAAQVSGRFDTFHTASNIFLDTSLQYASNEVWVDTTRISVVQTASTSMTQSMAAQSSAVRLENAFNQLDTSLATAGASAPAQGTLRAAGEIQQASNLQAAQASLESLSGQLYAAGTAVTLAGIDAGNDALMAHLDKQQAFGSWTQSLGQQGAMNRGGFGDVSFNLSGGLAGHDIKLGSNGFAGVAVAQMNSDGQMASGFDRQRSHSTEGSLYAGTRGANWYSVGRLGYGSFRGDMRRMLRFGDQASFAGSDLNGNYTSAYGEVGYRTQMGGLSLTPFANVQFATIRRDGFQEMGGDGFGLAANGHTTSRWQAGLGLRAGGSFATSYGLLHLDAKLGWQNAFATRGEVFAARYTGFSQWAPVEGIGLSRSAATAGLNLGLDLSERTQLSFGMDQRFADRDHARSATAAVRIAW